MMIVSMISILLVQGFSLPDRPEVPSNRHFWHEMRSPASASATNIWHVWTDVARWHTWDTGLKDASLDTEIGLGAKGKLTSLEGQRSKITFVEWEAESQYTFRTRLPLASLYVRRSLSRKAGDLWICHEVWFKGPLAGLFARMFGPRFRELLPSVMEGVLAQAS